MIWDFSYDSPNAITNLLQERGFSMSKKFGQNFLISSSARKRIADAVISKQGVRVWEVGPGIGALTVQLLNRSANVTAFEIDHGFCRILRNEAFIGEPNFNLIEGDVLKTWEKVFHQQGTPDVICGNLPYNVGSVCIAKFLEKQCLPQLMVYTLQKEVADRLSASEGSKLWSSFTILANIDYKVRTVCSISSQSFYPPPNVDSSVVMMEKRVQPLVGPDERRTFLTMVDDVFAQRRKTLRNNLLSGKTVNLLGKENLLERLELSGIPNNERAEQLGFPDLLLLHRYVFQEH
ncbi:MAG: 16S rRNA (adenine(1518)-N(6)/adenine(1519)-N(6))-dimethyltransferase RsmA [Sphaerochaetaceae bacterium]|jgi:16S rRNA (adenine1518-N6/adenine1519-N6)-dimethyltransferase|nr:16S rRNA (adenine(1518)-N(6)/adenine(1519)-N(6))-dimethyltransferase RsmA [Sphaerochaetaceae bacterium]NLO60571.1 ribosomal RNA small subunit methyltransferase A [Spirochaetales bacterium]